MKYTLFISFFAVTVVFANVTASMVDLDEDGEPEVVLENEYLIVGVLTGKAPQNPPDKLNANGKPIPSKHARRFNWGSWIWEVICKLTGRDLFVHENGSQRLLEVTGRRRQPHPALRRRLPLHP